MFVNEDILKLGRDPAALLAFFLTQRTGSNALTRWLHGVVPREEIYFYRNVSEFLHWPKHDAASLNGFRIYAAFSEYRPLDLGRPVVPFSLVRHPFYRLVSLYQLSRRDKLHWLYETAQRTDLLDYYTEGSAAKPYYFHNLNCYRVCGKPDAATAIKTIEERYALVGTTGGLPVVTAKLAEAYGWSAEPLPQVAPDEEKYAKYADTPAFQAIMASNQEDLKLYQFVSSFAKPKIAAPTATAVAPVAARGPVLDVMPFKDNFVSPALADPSVCPVCGDALNEVKDGNCPGCKSPARNRTLHPVLERFVGPLAKHAGLDHLPLLVIGMTQGERKLLSPHFKSYKSVSLFGKYAEGHETGVDIRDLSRYPDNSFSGAFGVLLFDYFPEHEKALGELSRVIAPGGVLFTLILTSRVHPDRAEPRVLKEIKSRPGYFDYVPPGGLLSVVVGQDWFLDAMHRAGFEAQQARILDHASGEVSQWFIGVKRGGSAPAPGPRERAPEAKPAAAPAIMRETRKVEGHSQEFVVKLDGFDGFKDIAVTLTIPTVPKAGLDTDFAEHVWIEAEQRSAPIVVCGGTGALLISDDLGKSWDLIEPKGLAGKRIVNSFTTAGGTRILQMPGWEGPKDELRPPADWGAIYLLHPDGTTSGPIKNGDARWHGPRSIAEVGTTLMYAEYAENLSIYDLEPGTPEWKANLRSSHVFRSRDGGKTWKSIFEAPPHEVRHLHLLMPDPEVPKRWWLTSGDRPHECRVWRSSNNGKTWEEVTNPKPDLALHPKARHRLQCAFRMTDLAFLPGKLLWGADDILGDHDYWPKAQGETPKMGARLFTAPKDSSPLAPVEIAVGDHPYRSLVDVGEGFLAITEAKFDALGYEPRVSFVDKREPHRTQLLFEVPNPRHAGTAFTHSKTSRAALNGTFFSYRGSGDFIKAKPRLLKWDVRFG